MANCELEFLDRYWEYLKTSLDESGFFMCPGLARKAPGFLEVVSAAGPAAAYGWLVRCIEDADVEEAVIGIDRFTRPGQGTEFADALVLTHWLPGSAGSPGVIRVGVVNYQWPDTVRPIDWGNRFWPGTVKKELQSSEIFVRVADLVELPS